MIIIIVITTIKIALNKHKIFRPKVHRKNRIRISRSHLDSAENVAFIFVPVCVMGISYLKM